MSLYSLGKDLTFREAIQLTNALLSDPRSLTATKLSNHSHPFTREWELLALLTEFFVAANSKKSAKKFKIPRPWDRKEKIGRVAVAKEAAQAYFARFKRGRKAGS